jgi:hypothetical protein
MKRIIFGVLIFIIIISLLPYAEGAEDQIYLYVNQGEETEHLVVFVGEYRVYLKVIYGQNCSNWIIDLDSPILLHPLKGMTPESVSAGKVSGFSLDINPEAPPGHYPIVVYFNYSNEENKKISNRFNLSIEYIKPFELKEINIPKGRERNSSLKLETFMEFTELKVLFDSDGDIETEKHEIILENVSTGNYTFKTNIYKRETFAGDAQELGYWIIGTVNNRTVEFGENNIPVKITWTEEEKKDGEEGFIPGFEAIFVLISILIILSIKRKKSY